MPAAAVDRDGVEAAPEDLKQLGIANLMRQLGLAGVAGRVKGPKSS